MRISRPSNIRELIVHALASELPRGNQSLPALEYLCDVDTELGRDDEIRKMVIEYLNCRASGYRDHAARALHAIGDPLGILHLTYNCLSTHPVTGQYRPGTSGWSDISLIQRAASMTDECIDLLIQDIRNPPGYLHADALSVLPVERIAARMLSLLDQPDRIAVQAAYVLALKERDEGRTVLERLVETMNLRFLEMAIIGLSHIPNQHAVELINGLTNPNHQIYRKSDHEFEMEGLSKKRLLAKSLQRLLAMNREKTTPFLEIMRRFYMLPTSEWRVGSGIVMPVDLVAPTLFIAWQDHVITPAPDFIVEFATEADRKELAEIQKAGMREFLKAVPVERLLSNRWPNFMLWNRHPRDSKDFNHTVFGVKITNAEEDYLFAAADWILNPQDYRIGSHRYFPRSLGL